MSWKPTFATGKLVRDYEPLRLYLELVKGTEWYDRAFLSQRDFERLVDVVKRINGKANLLAVWKELAEEMKDRIEPKAAFEALTRSGYEVKDEEEARELMAKLLAGWLLEAGEEWDLIRLSM